MAKPQKSTAQSEVPGLVKKGPLYYLKRDWQLYALMLLPMVFIIVFKYFAYTGLSVAFLDYKIGKGYAGSKFVGLKIFEKVFKHRDFTKAVVNTLLLNVLDLIFSFPMPIILALLLNEIRVKWFKRTTQTLLYLPHFLSWVVIGAVAYQMFATQSGVVNALIANAGKSPIPLRKKRKHGSAIKNHHETVLCLEFMNFGQKASVRFCGIAAGFGLSWKKSGWKNCFHPQSQPGGQPRRQGNLSEPAVLLRG